MFWGTPGEFSGVAPGGALEPLPDLDEYDFGEREFGVGGVRVPDRIRDKYESLRDNLSYRLGIDQFQSMLAFRSGSSNPYVIHIWNPFSNFMGVNYGTYDVYFGVSDISRQDWVPFIRMLCLFMVVCLFFYAVVTTFTYF